MTNPTILPFTTCQIPNCHHILGQESRDLNMPFCQDHRKCESCDLPISSQDAQLCLKKARFEETPLIVVRHARCQIIVEPLTKEDPTQIKIDLLNICRLAIIPDPTLSVETNKKQAELFGQKLVVLMTLEEKILHLEMLEALAVQMRYTLLPKDREKISKTLSERGNKKFDEALKDRKANETKAPHTVKVKKNMLSRAIDALTQPPVNLPYPIAIKTVYEQETLKGTTTLVAYRLILDAMMSLKSEENQAREILESLKIKEE